MTGVDEHDAVLDRVATPSRAVAVVAGLVGPSITFGPVPAGPHAMATARASGTVGRPTARRTGPGRGVVSVPAALDVVVTIGRKDVPVDARLVVRVGLAGRLVDGGSAVEVDVAPIGPGDIDVDTRTSGVGGVFLQRYGDLDAEIRHHVGAYVSGLLATEEAMAATRLAV